MVSPEEYEWTARLGSPLDGVLTISDATDKVLARAEAPSAKQPDPGLKFTLPADGTYRLRVQDRFRSRGGSAFAYRVRLDHAVKPDFRLSLASDAVTVPRKGQAKLKVEATRFGGFKEPITLEVVGLPPGVQVSGNTIAGQQTSTELTFRADEKAKI
jgi:hypothetical protein